MITHRILNRTLLDRQHLLERSGVGPLPMTEHLLGLQAQDVLPPYLSLHARLADFDPHTLSEALERRDAVRLVVMRGTIHLLTRADAPLLRGLSQPQLTRVIRNTAWGRGFPEARYGELADLAREVLADGQHSPKALGEALRARFPEKSASDLGNLARHLVPLVQLPPRGAWKQPGGQQYRTLEDWLGDEVPGEIDLTEVVRRYLRAFGPATAADVTAWSGATGMREVFRAMKEELVEHRTEGGGTVSDLDGLRLADAEAPAPVRLLGKYDNLWLSHAGRDRVTPDPAKRKRWMGVNGGMANTVFVDGELEGLWRQHEGRVDVELFRELTRAERAELEAEVSRTEGLLAR